MPNWKKIVTSGSNAHLNQITASGNISSSHTGSFGKLTIGAPPTMTHANTQLTVAGGSGGVDIASFYRNISGTGRVNISFSDSDPTIEFFEDSNDKTNSIGSDATNSNFVFATGSKLKDKEAMVIQNDGGNVGIGTISPSAKLDITGDLRVSSHITASGNISASGTGTNNFGGNIYVDTDNYIGEKGETGRIRFRNNLVSVSDGELLATEGLDVTGHITASGNISASGNINSAFYKIRSQTLASRHSTQGITFGNSSDKANIDGVNIKLNAPVTASGDISASGVLSGQSLKINGTTAIDDAGVSTPLFRIGAFGGFNSYRGSTNFEGPVTASIISSSGNAHVNQITASSFQFVGSGNAELEVQGHITASGNISSSGKITANNFIADDATGYHFSGDNVRLIAGTGGDNLSIQGGGLRAEGNITASGNISSSGDITSNTLNVNTSGELTGSYGTLHGAFNINYGNGTTFSASLASAGDGYGEIISHLRINAASAGDVVYHSGADWRPTDADNENASNGMIGVALADGGPIGVGGPVLIRGMVRLGAGHVVGTVVDGDPLYLSTTSGHVQYAVPGAGDFARIVGYSIDGDNDIIYFNPSSTFVEVST